MRSLAWWRSWSAGEAPGTSARRKRQLGAGRPASEGTEGAPSQDGVAPEAPRATRKRFVQATAHAPGSDRSRAGRAVAACLRLWRVRLPRLDPETGLHITGTPTEVDIASYRLKVTGKVDQELSLSYEEILDLTPEGHRFSRPGLPRILRGQGHAGRESRSGPSSIWPGSKRMRPG